MQIKNYVTANVDERLIPVLDQLISRGSIIDESDWNLINYSLEDLSPERQPKPMDQADNFRCCQATLLLPKMSI